MALSYKRGETVDVSGEVKRVADSMTEEELVEFATKPKNVKTHNNKKR